MCFLMEGNIVVVLEVNVLEDVEEIRFEWWLCVEMVVMLICSGITRLYVIIVCDGCIILGGVLGTQNRTVLISFCCISKRRCC